MDRLAHIAFVGAGLFVLLTIACVAVLWIIGCEVVSVCRPGWRAF